MTILGAALQASRRINNRRWKECYQCSFRRPLSISLDHDRRENSEKRVSSSRYLGRGLVGSPLVSRGSPLHSQRALSGIYNRSPLCSQQSRSLASWLPEVVQNFSIWGGSGFLLKTLHADGVVPYWACFALINLLLRATLFPLVIYGAHTSTRFAKVVPEVQFLLSLFQNDMNKMREEKAPWVKKAMLMRTNMSSLGGIYKLHKINPFSVFLSPLLQIPLFWYVSVDLRKIVNGLDPLLAQQLVESSIAWVPDLTEPDPWFGLPIIAGLVMYANVEVAVGRRNLSGPTAAKSDTAVLLKDVFQSLAVFMPCFTSQMPGGVQIYLITSFAFTFVQSAALRTESFRQMVGLPSMLAPPPEAKYAQTFINLKKLEQKAREIRGDGPVLGKGVLALDFEASFPGEYRKSTIKGSGMAPLKLESMPKVEPPAMKVIRPTGPFVSGVSAPPWQLVEQQEMLRRHAKEHAEEEMRQDVSDREYMPEFSDEIMAKANRGELPVATQFVDTSDARKKASKLNMNRFKKGKKQQPGSKKPRR